MSNRYDVLAKALGWNNEDGAKPADIPQEKFRRDKAVPKRAKHVTRESLPEGSMPKVGQGVAVCHKSTLDKNQRPQLTRAEVEHRKIKAVYLSDNGEVTIKDNAGDTWAVRPASIGHSQWETFTKGGHRG